MSRTTVPDRSGPLEFEVPPELEAHDPPEARGLARDGVRLMVAHRKDLRLEHARFRDLAGFLNPGDLLVINNSGTLPAAVPAVRADGTSLELHLSTPLPSGQGPVDLQRPPGPEPQVWVVELRRPSGTDSLPFREATPGETLRLPEASVQILEPYPPDCGPFDERSHQSRLWTAALRLPFALGPYLEQHGHPIRYGYVTREWPVSYYQTVYAMEAGSAEMPSAGRAFTPEMITALISGGIDVAPITLHTGVASLEEHEPPPAEFYRVSEETARRVSLARASGGRVIAVGTTVVRALETVADGSGTVRAGSGWTKVVISPVRGLRVVDGLLTGWHEPRASHMLMLEAVAGRELLEASYRAALAGGYLWHEFGDLHLVLP
ncbi:MAG TPA: queuosine biosynthesis protein [Actinobacteria bacterium]|nr:queuosine biosynthesis protein [Actinomycetota bacterium]